MFWTRNAHCSPRNCRLPTVRPTYRSILWRSTKRSAAAGRRRMVTRQNGDCGTLRAAQSHQLPCRAADGTLQPLLCECKEEPGMTNTVAQFRDELADREAIRDCLFRYARASDRCDEHMLRDVYWPDAHDDHMEFSGSLDEFVAYALPILRAMGHNMHMMGNILISIKGNRADVETYFQGYHCIADNGTRRDIIAGGRYLDNFEKRGDIWRIIKRFVIVDWFRDYPDTGDWVKGPFGMKVERGGLKPADKSYELLKLI